MEKLGEIPALFPSARIWGESPKCHPGSVLILIANEDRFNDVVNKNKRDFEEVLSVEIIDGLQLLGEAKNRPLIHEVLKAHQALAGIVLGYGRDNCWVYLGKRGGLLYRRILRGG